MWLLTLMNSFSKKGVTQKMKNIQMALVTVFAGAVAMSAAAETANHINVTKFHQSHPY